MCRRSASGHVGKIAGRAGRRSLHAIMAEAVTKRPDERRSGALLSWHRTCGQDWRLVQSCFGFAECERVVIRERGKAERQCRRARHTIANDAAPGAEAPKLSLSSVVILAQPTRSTSIS